MNRLAILAPVFVLFASLLVFHNATVFTGFALTPGESGDSMLVNYALEHGYRWLKGGTLGHSLWSPPIFYPQRDTAAYTDLMLGALPPYAFWRIAGMKPLTAFQLWIITVSGLNFCSAYWLLSQVLKCGLIGASAGALLLAFGSPRLAQVGHPQLWPCFYTVIAFGGICMLFMRDAGGLTSGQVHAGLLLALSGWCAQVYTAFYYAWFMAATMILGVAVALLMPDSRLRVIGFLTRWWRPTLAAAVLSSLALAPYARVTWKVFGQLGGRTYEEVQSFLPVATAWLAQGPNHLLYGGLNRLAAAGPAFASGEMFNGIGLFTTGLVAGGFVLFRKRFVIRLWGVIVVSVLALSLLWPGGYSLWSAVYNWFPGAPAIRAVSRFGVFLLLPFSVALAFLMDRMALRSVPAAIACVLAIGLEQAGSLHQAPNYSKAQAQAGIDMIARQIRPECQTLLFSWRGELTTPQVMHVMGMWAGLASNVPALNGYSGQSPPHWPLGDVAVSTLGDRVRVRQQIEVWMAAHPADFKNVCWILPEANPPLRASLLVLSNKPQR